MDLLLILTYTAICIAIFKIFRIPLNKWTVPTAVLGGVVLIGALIFTMNYNHPYSEVARSYFVSTPVIPVVTGQVIEVPVKGNQMIEKGTVLFRIDPKPFQLKLDSIKAQLVSARADQSRARELALRNVGNKRDVDLTTARVDDLNAQLALAQFNLDNTVVRAPSRGFVTHVSLRPGMMATRLPLRPSMVFVPDEGQYFAAWMRQNSQLRLTAGDEAEVAFDGIPGKVFSGKVKQAIGVIGEGPGDHRDYRSGLCPVRQSDARWCLRPGGNLQRAFPPRGDHAQDSPAHGGLDELHLPVPLIRPRAAAARPQPFLPQSPQNCRSELAREPLDAWICRADMVREQARSYRHASALRWRACHEMKSPCRTM